MGLLGCASVCNCVGCALVGCVIVGGRCFRDDDGVGRRVMLLDHIAVVNGDSRPYKPC